MPSVRNHVVQTRVDQETYDTIVYLSELENRKVTDTLDLVVQRGLEAMRKDERDKKAFLQFKEALQEARPEMSEQEAIKRITAL